MKEIKTIGVLTSGGDAPGMNACIRAVTRSAIFNGMNVMGIYRGYEGLIHGEFKELTTESVSNTIQRGGTILKTARSKDFQTPEGRKQAYDNLEKFGVDALIVIGGNGSLTGAQALAREYDFPVIGLPGTIDNDLYGTDSTIGYDTALNTIVECVDKLRDTATSHDRIFFVEVMGRDAGFLAQNSAIASGAEAAIIPEDQTDVDQLEQFISRGFRKSKNSSIVIVSESPKDGGAMYYADRVRKEYPQYDVRVTISDTFREAVPQAPSTEFWQVVWDMQVSKRLRKDSATSWSASAMTRLSMFLSTGPSRKTNLSTGNLSMCLQSCLSDSWTTILNS